MSIVFTIALLLVIAAGVSLILSLGAVAIMIALKLLPIVLILAAVLFFLRGGKVTVELPERWRRR